MEVREKDSFVSTIECGLKVSIDTGPVLGAHVLVHHTHQFWPAAVGCYELLPLLSPFSLSLSFSLLSLSLFSTVI